MNERMLQRCRTWDYRARGIYMITLTTLNRRPLFGRLVGGEAAPAICRSALGELVARCWEAIPSHFPDVGANVEAPMVMPDHFHGVLFVYKEQAKPLGAIIRGFKAGVSKEARALGLVEGPIWAPGFHDRILFQKGQLEHMLAYIRDNPRRLAVKQAHPELFRVVRDLPLVGHTFAAIGNHFLLDRPVRLALQCSRRISPEALARQQEQLLAQARQGAVLISPCISPGEKQIARAALEAELPLVVLLENGFPPLYKPPKRYFEACAQGRLLMLAPWPYHSQKRVITREQCLALNGFAARLASP